MDDDPRDRRKTSSAGMPIVAPATSAIAGPRAPTPAELQSELARLRADSARFHAELLAALRDRPPSWYTQTVERHDKAINEWMSDVGRKLPGQLSAIETSIGTLSAEVSGTAKALREFRTEIRTRLGEHHARLEEQASEISTIREDVTDKHAAIEKRLAELEQQHAGDKRELALTRTEKLKRDGRTGLISTIVGILSGVISHLIGG